MSLIQKYNVPGPRYTSYPSVPYWDVTNFTSSLWLQTVKKTFELTNQEQGISLYIHLPFCESLCTFCGCHKKVTKRHELEMPYIKAVLKEWSLYCKEFTQIPIIKEIHLGGGTPTFFSPDNLKFLLQQIYATCKIASNPEFSFEGHPCNTTKAHLQTLYDLGFRRVSFGVQDYSPQIQRAINRNQNFHDVAKVTLWAKEIGYSSISHDVIYGLPFQKMSDIIDTMEKTNSLKPDRLAFYSYAHVPWVKGNGQRGFKEKDIPCGELKQDYYQTGKKLLLKNGYTEIGMDHFALKTDSLYKALNNGQIHRNFMGYTSSKTQLLIGLGVSSIGDSWLGFAQNEKDLDKYYQLISQDKIPVVKGHILSQEDLIIRKHILNLMCNLQTDLQGDVKHIDVDLIFKNLDEMKKDLLIQTQDYQIKVTRKGRAFIRNICMALDLQYQRNKPTAPLFSMTI
ncbi:oxygen-independent coproporphyrinogen III oxidase [Myroides sp. LJL119]